MKVKGYPKNLYFQVFTATPASPPLKEGRKERSGHTKLDRPQKNVYVSDLSIGLKIFTLQYYQYLYEFGKNQNQPCFFDLEPFE